MCFNPNFFVIEGKLVHIYLVLTSNFSRVCTNSYDPIRKCQVYFRSLLKVYKFYLRYNKPKNGLGRDPQDLRNWINVP